MSGRTLQAGSTLLIEGQASFKLSEGEASSLGAPLQLDTWTIVRDNRQLPIETPSRALLEIRLGPGGKHRTINGSTIPTGWREASQVLREAPGTVAVLGRVDSGKSTLCTFLANECYGNGSQVCVIDGDVGQADIGPPTTISMSLVKGQVFSLQELEPDISLFIGDTSPSSVPEKLSVGLSRLRDLGTEKSDIILVNTDGWTEGEEAFRHKLQLLNHIKPDIVLGISPNGEMDALLDQLNLTVLKLERSSYARSRSREERRRARESGYKKFLQGSRRMEVQVRDVELRRFNSQRQLKISEDGDLTGLVAGLLDGEERLLAISRIESLRSGVLTVRTLLRGYPRIVELGAVVLSAGYEELGYDS